MLDKKVSEIFDASRWSSVDEFDFEDITYHRALEHGTVRIAFNRPAVRNAFRPQTCDELLTALEHATALPDVGCVLLTGNGPSPKDGGWAFCAGGDQQVRGKDGYQQSGKAGRMSGRFVMEVQRAIRFMPKIVIAVVPGFCVGGGHSLHVVCDLTIASKEHATFMQRDPDVGSFDAGYGAAFLARHVGQKRGREIFFIGLPYCAEDAFRMRMVNAVVPHEQLESFALDWAAKINSKSPTAMKMLKYGFNLPDDGLVGQQLFQAEATRLAYGAEEGQEGRHAFVEKRAPDFSRFPWTY